MIDFPVPAALERLKAFQEPYCVSLYVPMPDPSAATSDQARIDLKHLVRDAKIALHEAGMPKHKIRKTMRQAEQLLDLNEFWPPRHESMALFMHEKFFRYYHIADQDIPYHLTVGQGFYLEPLYDAMHANRSYFVLALGHKNVRLYQGDHFNLELVRLEKFPSNMTEVLRIDERPQSRQTHTIAPAYLGKGSEAYHEQYDASHVDKEELEEFFRRVDQRLHYFLTSQHKPLILAGAERLLPLYRKVNTYSYLWPRSIVGSIKNVPPNIIKNKAWSLISKP